MSFLRYNKAIFLTASGFFNISGFLKKESILTILSNY
nr:MAG TPA: protein of unknown function (DUF5446) [Crassvirales sp.]